MLISYVYFVYLIWYIYRMAARPDSVLFSDDDLRDAAEDVCFPHSEDQECINELKRGMFFFVF